MSENLEIPHVNNVKNGNIDYSGYVGCSSDNAVTANIPNSGYSGTIPFSRSEFSEFPTENRSEDNIDFYNLPAVDVSDLPTIDTYNQKSERMQRDNFQPLNDDSSDERLSFDDMPDIEDDSFPRGNHPNLANFNNHYIPGAPNSYNTNLVNGSLFPGTVPVPGNSANFNINQMMNYSSAPGASAMNPNFPPPTGASAINPNFPPPTGASAMNPNFPPPTGSYFTTSMPSNHAFKQPGGLKEVEALARYNIEQADNNSSSSGWNPPIFSNNMLDWGWNAVHRTPATFRCQPCQLLRRIIHTNGVQDSKLEIHGIQGVPIHAVSQFRLCNHDGREGSLNCEIIEFRDPEHIKQFIAEYNQVRSNEGSLLRYDSFLLTPDFGKSVKKKKFGSRGYWNRNINARGNKHNGNVNRHAQGSSSGTYIPKTAYSAQRLRTGKLEISEVARYFDLPLTDACSKLRICSSVVKNVCRRNFLRRWPHRKVTSINRRIQILERSLNSERNVNKENIRKKIAALRNDQTNLYSRFLNKNQIATLRNEGESL